MLCNNRDRKLFVAFTLAPLLPAFLPSTGRRISSIGVIVFLSLILVVRSYDRN